MPIVCISVCASCTHRLVVVSAARQTPAFLTQDMQQLELVLRREERSEETKRKQSSQTGKEEGGESLVCALSSVSVHGDTHSAPPSSMALTHPISVSRTSLSLSLL